MLKKYRTQRQSFIEDILAPQRNIWKLFLSLREELGKEFVKDGMNALKSTIRRLIKTHKQNFPNAKNIKEDEI